MYYYSSDWMTSWAWKNLIAMVQENYESVENKDDALIFGLYITTPISELKKQIIKEKGKLNKLIVYQTEPLVNTHNSVNPNFPSYRKIIDKLRDADEVWEFDYENAILLLKEGINVKYKPPVHTTSLNQIKTKENPEIDVLFYGGFSDRRARLIRTLHDGYAYSLADDTAQIFQNFNLVWTWNLSYQKLQEYIANCKIILNLHPYDGESRQQTVRMFYLLSNDKTIISERADVNYFGDSIHEFHDTQSLGNTLVHLLRNNNWKLKSNNYNKHFLNLKTRSNMAIFYDIETNENWRNKYLHQVSQLQVKNLYDPADYIHFNYREDLPLHFYKVNRYSKELNIDEEISNFKVLNPNHTIIKVTNDSMAEI